MQQIQVLPTVNGGQPIMIQGATTPQLIQTADGQTLVYQPVQVGSSFTTLIFVIFILCESRCKMAHRRWCQHNSQASRSNNRADKLSRLPMPDNRMQQHPQHQLLKEGNNSNRVK